MRAYLIGPDGHFVKCVELVCDDDEAAKEQAKTLPDRHDVELWQEAHRITEFRRTRAGRLSSPEPTKAAKVPDRPSGSTRSSTMATGQLSRSEWRVAVVATISAGLARRGAL